LKLDAELKESGATVVAGKN